MAENKQFSVSPSPHVKAPRSTKFIMANVCIALLPTAIAGCVFFGWLALAIIGLSVASAVLAEGIYLLIVGKKIKEIIKQFDFTSCVTGLLVGLTIGTNYPLYAPVLGSAFAIIVVKMLFGGTGKNIVNPAIVGRIFIFISFQSVMTAWIMPNFASLQPFNVSTGATALGGMLESNSVTGLSLLDMFLGTGMQGCIGETCKVTIIIGAIYLAIMRIIDIQYPLIYIAVEGLFAVALQGFDFAFFLPSILSGGLMLGAFFMATDYVTTPNTRLGNYIYFICLGLVTAGLRKATNMEVVSFAILLMNLFVPLIDKMVLHRPFGYVRQKKSKNKKEVK